MHHLHHRIVQRRTHVLNSLLGFFCTLLLVSCAKLPAAHDALNSSPYQAISKPRPLPNPDHQQLLPNECPPPSLACDSGHNPVLCTATHYEAQPIPQSLQPIAWGKNPCEGRQKLALTACSLGFLPSRIKFTQCVPDPSDGNCPPANNICTSEAQPSVCSAAAYAGQPLPNTQILQASGSNPCNAKLNLMNLACRQRLDPASLQQISCHDASNI